MVFALTITIFKNEYNKIQFICQQKTNGIFAYSLMLFGEGFFKMSEIPKYLNEILDKRMQKCYSTKNSVMDRDVCSTFGS